MRLQVLRISLFVCLALLLNPPSESARAADLNRHFSLGGDELAVANWIGEVQIEGYDGNSFEIDLFIRGADASAERIDFKVDEGKRSRLRILFPFDEERHFVYPAMGRHSKSTFRPGRNGHSNSLLDELLPIRSGKKITVSGSGSGLELWVDAVVKVPWGKKIVVEQAVGAIGATDLQGDAVLDTQTGRIQAHRVEGDLLIDTGSGSVDVEAIQGELNIDTGSGSVTLKSCDGSSILVDTGSGSVDADAVRCERLAIDTGSGRVRAKHVKADEANIDTGSGSVELDLDEMGGGSFVIDTGSGRIDLRLPETASAEIHAETGSGRITCDLDEARFRSKHQDELDLRVGGGDAIVQLDAGSGSIHITQ